MLTVGCDPEFIVTNEQGQKQYAHAVSHAFNDIGQIGVDHCGRVGELRPKHGTPKEVTANIKKMFTWIKKNHPEKKIFAGGGQKFDESIGGHIHIGGIDFNYFTRFHINRSSDNDQISDEDKKK